MEKSQFLGLAFQVQSTNTVNCDRLDEAEAEVWRLREEQEASHKVQMELCEGLVNAIGGVDLAQEWLMEQGPRDRSQIGLLTTQVANLKATMAIREVECTTADAARDEVE